MGSTLAYDNTGTIVAVKKFYSTGSVKIEKENIINLAHWNRKVFYFLFCSRGHRHRDRSKPTTISMGTAEKVLQFLMPLKSVYNGNFIVCLNTEERFKKKIY